MKAYSYKPIFRKTTLANGVRVVTESHPFTRAASVGVFIDVGTRDETYSKAGITHFLEHMVFKGTRSRTSYDLAKVLDAVGGDLNAYTTKEYTCIHATSLKEHLPLSLDVVTDLVTNATITADAVKKEREVIIQEIQMSKDSLEEYILDLFLEMTYADDCLGTPILGSEETLYRINRKDIVDHYKGFFCGPRIIVSVAGPVEHEDVVRLVEKALGNLPKRNMPNKRKTPKIKVVQEFIPRPSEQVHLLVGLPSCSYNSKHRFEAYVVNDILGGGVTSRFYQKIREDKGLVYSVYSYLQSFVDTGLLLTYAGASPENSPSVLKIMKSEFKKFCDKGIKKSELKMFKTQLKGQILLGAEDMENRMNSIGVNEMIYQQYRPIDRVIEDIDDVSLDSIGDYVHKYFNPDKMSLMIMGDLEPVDALKLMEIWK